MQSGRAAAMLRGMSLLLAPVARCTSVADIAAALRRARAEGHGPALDLRPLRRIYVNPVRRIAWVQPGATWAELDAATQEHGLAVTGDRDPHANVAASTLASGSGWLERWMGLTGDNLRAARVMSADGIVFSASERENPDLFWTLRGGGEAPAVVVELELSLRPLGPELLGGVLSWPRERASEVVRAYRDLMAGAPDALCGGLRLAPAAVEVVFLYAGAPERGAGHLAALRALRPATDGVGLTTYRELQALAGGDLLLQPLGGAYGRVGELETAAPGRAAAWADRRAARGTPERETRLAAVRERWDPYGVFAGR